MCAARTYPVGALGTGGFRLLQVSPHQEGAPLEGRLSEHRLNDPPQYIPVSYTWGPAELPELASPPQNPVATESDPVVLLNGVSWEVTPSLFDLFKALSSDPEIQSMYFWIDALCINQDDIEEKTDQVNLMCRIYSRGAFVFVWLGPANEHTTRVSVMIRQLSKMAMEEEARHGSLDGLETLQDLTTPESLRRLRLDEATTWEDWVALVCFYHRRWFFRAWTIQELALSTRNVVRCGTEVLIWAELYNAAAVMQSTNVGQAVLLRVQRQVSVTNQSFGINLFHGAASLGDRHHGAIMEQEAGFRVWLRADSQACAAASMSFLISSSRVTGAFDPRDRIFAFLGIWEKIATERFAEQFNIKADYKKTVQTVYTEFMAMVLRSTGSLNVLSSVQRGQRGVGPVGVEGLPSWVPDYSTAQAAPIIQYLSGRKPLELTNAYANVGSYHPPVQLGAVSNDEVKSRHFHIRGNELLVPSFVFGTVTHVGSSYLEMQEANFEKTLAMLLLSPLKYPDGRSRLEAFHSMLVYDLDQPPASRFRTLWTTQFIAQIHTGRHRAGMHAEEYLDKIGIPRFLELILADEVEQYFPTLAELKSTCQSLGCWEGGDWDTRCSEMQKMSAEVSKLDIVFKYTYEKRRPFLLDSGHFGMASQDVRPGDTVRILPGARAFFTFRKGGQEDDGKDCRVLIGEAYVGGAMAGERAEYIGENACRWDTICVI
ncbi:heterokaryon incompatibility protein-domain-containing protein [Xylariaceae sp. FL0804]|nr:heterokaryon incompatibility protein-domain-containing protein [Xylariaceae sp. FL0804]